MTTLPAGVIHLRDFKADGGLYGRLNPTGQGLTGAGRGSTGTVFRLDPKSSTRKRKVPTKKGTTNPLYVVKLQGGTNVRVADFAVEGTPQGHLFNGLRIDRVKNLHASGLRVAGIPGNSDINPGETFLLNIYRGTNVDLHDVELDGAGIGSSGLGLNTCSGTLLVERLTGHDLKKCKAVALWKQTDGGRFVGVESLHNAFGFGFERCDGRYDLVGVKFRGSTRADIHLANDGGAYGRAKLHIQDPDLAPGQRVKVLLSKTELGNPNRQTESDVVLTVDGKVRNDLLHFVRKA